MEVSNEELGRRLDDFARDWRDDFLEIKAGLTALLPREVYEARHTALAGRVQQLETRHDQDVAALRAEIQSDRDQRRTDRKFLVSAIIIPVALFIAQLWMTAQGGGAA